MHPTAPKIVLLPFALTAAVAAAAGGIVAGRPAHGNPARGAELYQSRCGACHSPDDNGAGPLHRGVFGRRAATQAGFDYSDALRKSNLIWDEATLNRWLEDPGSLVPGNKMAVRLVPDVRERADVIAYLQSLSADSKKAP